VTAMATFASARATRQTTRRSSGVRVALYFFSRTDQAAEMSSPGLRVRLRAPLPSMLAMRISMCWALGLP
jgi:hypothetical protein